jgi:hypothetical protein
LTGSEADRSRTPMKGLTMNMTSTDTRWLRRALGASVVAVAILLPLACSDDSTGSSGSSAASSSDDSTPAATPVVDPGDGGEYDVTLDPADFVDVVDNPYMPLSVGSTWVYEGTTPDGTERVEIEVLDERRDIQGISATVVRDTVTVEGELVEDTYDWFAQDTEGNVWYLGEDVRDFENGEVVSTDGSFEAGTGAAQAGIVMLAHPQVGDAYRQEFDPGNAEDLAEVLATDGSVDGPSGSYQDVLVTEDWNPLEPDVVENKHYAPGVGLVFEEKVQGDEGQIELIQFTPGR